MTCAGAQYSEWLLSMRQMLQGMYIVPFVIPAAAEASAIIGFASVPMIVLWWLLFSRAPWLERIGAFVAMEIWNLRASDGTTLVVSNAFPGGPGLWSPTPGGPATPVNQQYAYATPWVLRSASQFRPGPK